ncbi:MAG: hypothetical protein ACRDZX_16365 [Acidimicrobiales bacterium]
MPWCDDCSKFWNPPELGAGGRCPRCRRVLAAPAPTSGPLALQLRGPSPRAVLPTEPPGEPLEAPGPAPASVPKSSTARAKGAPWHFKLLVVGVTGYMIYRIYWFIEWLPKHI